MKNEDYLALLDGSEQEPEERMKTIVSIIQKQLEDITAGLAKDASLTGRIPAESLKKYANDKFNDMKTGLEKDHILYVELYLNDDGGERQWHPVVTFKKAGMFDRLFLNQNYGERYVGQPSRWTTHGGSDEGRINHSHLSEEVIRTINESDERMYIGSGDRITAGTINTGSFTANITPLDGNPIRVDSISAGTIAAMQMETRHSHTPFRVYDEHARREAPRIRERYGTGVINTQGLAVARMDTGVLQTAAPAMLAEAAFSPDEREMPRPIEDPNGTQLFDYGPLRVERSELREATWDTRSVTDDMQELNHHRIIRDIERGLNHIVEEHLGAAQVRTVTERQLIQETQAFLGHFQREGRVQEYEFENFRADPNDGGIPATTMTVRVQLPRSTEWIHISVRMTP